MSTDASLAGKVLTGVRWAALGQIAAQLLNFIVTLALVRLLLPSDFGLLAMTTVFTGFAAFFGEMGFGKALIQHEGIDDRHLTSVFWLNIASGAVLTALAYLAAPAIAAFFVEPRLILLVRILSLNFAFAALSHVQIAVLERDMLFRRLMGIDTGAAAIAGVTAVACAVAGFGVWSLVFQMLTRTAATVLMAWSGSAWRPSLRVDPAAIRDLRRYGLNAFGSQIVTYWIRNGDNLLIGKFAGAVSLGLYTQAYRS